MRCQPFRRVLVANRGEIAVRVIRGCHERNIEAVAVYSDADSDALHVRLADAAFAIGPAPSSLSYLRPDLLLDVAARAGCDAVHPGYGYLSENAAFATTVLEAGLVWIGPPPAAIAAMGNKTEARKRMHAAGVPVVPGTLGAVSDEAEATQIAASIGYPVMIKAAAGGGGKGMRRVDNEAGLRDALASAASEASRSFGDGAVYIEKLIERPRHVEIQILADAHGHVIHLHERDCSLQRRHQKVLEETPCPALSEGIRTAMGDAATAAAAAVQYVGAGTCEFLLGPDGAFWFLEMNTRLQVEHPITEAITGMDLVQAQLRVAAGEPLWLTQAEVPSRGHAIECRLYAEDVGANFRPSPGTLVGYREPGGPFVRVDSGVVEGMEIPVHYDPMIAKLVVWGSTRDEAIRRSARALRDWQVVGVPTSIPFFLALFSDPEFLAGNYDTGFITPEWLAARCMPSASAAEMGVIAAAIATFEAERSRRPAPSDSGPWRRAGLTS